MENVDKIENVDKLYLFNKVTQLTKFVQILQTEIDSCKSKSTKIQDEMQKFCENVHSLLSTIIANDDRQDTKLKELEEKITQRIDKTCDCSSKK